MKELININTTALEVKEYKGQRVVTLREIDEVHQRPEGTARRNFNANRNHLIEGVDYFEVTQPNEIRTLGILRPQGGTPSKVTIITESGYLMLVKSFTDDLAWAVQRELVNNYFRAKVTLKPASPGAEKRAAAMLLNAKSRTAKQMMALWTAAGVKPEYQALALGDYYREDGIRLPAVALQSTKVTYDKTTIAGKLGVMSKVGKPHAAAVGAIIAKLVIGDDEREQVPYQRNGHDGFDYQYTDSVIERVKTWLEMNHYPSVIVAGEKNYQVRYLRVEEAS